MNEHIGKPFELDHLIAVILQLCGRNANDKEAQQEKSEVIDKVLIDQASACGIDLPAAIKRLGGNLGTYRRLLINFISEINNLPKEMQQALMGAQTALLARQAHTLKGVCATLGINQLATLAAKAESTFNRSDMIASEDDLDVLIQGMSAFVEPLKAFSQKLSEHDNAALQEKAGKPANTEAIIECIKQLQIHLIDIDMEAVNVIEHLRTLAWGHHANELQAIDEDVVELQFDDALEKCSSFLADHIGSTSTTTA
jgi:HPt (histidine-containing phosphotransfer) domain-containing protein